MKKLEAIERIEGVRRELIKRGFHCLAGGKFGLPSYSNIEAWAKGSRVFYLLYDRDTGGWDILASLDHTNTIEATWEAVDRFAKGGAS